jgi:spoIIIJ-associated protein
LRTIFYDAGMSLPRARETLELMLGHLGLVFEVEEIEQGGRSILQVSTREAGRLIGRDGHTLEDLQYLLNRILNRHDESAPNVIVDVEGYRQKEKQDFLERIRELAEQVRRTGRPIVLAPLNSFDRRLVHQAFAEDPDIATESEEGTARLKQITLVPRASRGDAPRPESA